LTPKNFLPIGLILLAAVFIASCSNQKNTAMRRGYHNLTAHYNVYFNGNEGFKKGVAKFEETYQDNYTDLLPVMLFPDNSSASSISSDMEYSIKKAVKLIKQHSITKRPKKRKSTSTTFLPGSKGRASKNKEFNQQTEFCKWVDDAYLLMGKAHLYKRDFVPAIKSFEIVINDFGKFGLKNQALLWMARTYVENNDFVNASKIIDQLDAERNFPEKYRADFELIQASFFMKQKKYEYTIDHLEDALKFVRKKQTKARICFILAQLNQRLGNQSKASAYYAQVIKYNPPYSLAFTAKINRAGVFSGSGGEDIEKQLRQMLKDDKNIDYLDQIYYALANVELKRKNVPEAEKNFKLSAASSVSNDNQKAMSFLALADINYSRADYLTAQAYFDSTMSYLDPKFSEYEKINEKAKMLKLLSDNLMIIQKEDSLQRIAKMPEKARIAFVDELIIKVKQQEERKKSEQQNEELNKRKVYNYGSDQVDPSSNPVSSAKWYFYNPQAVSFGSAEFLKKWGRRKLEDNWRRKNKAIVMENYASETTNEQETTIADKAMDNKSREFYLKGLPISDTLINRSNQKIIKAYAKLGEVYAENLKEYKQSIFYLETLDKKFPDHQSQPTTYYQLYNYNTKLGNKSEAEKYKNLLLTKHPNSTYGKIVANPNYLSELNKNRKQADRIYEQLYAEYRNKNYSSVLAGCNDALATYPSNPLVPKFLILKAYCEGALGNTDAAKLAVEKVILQYPESEVINLAKDMAASIKRSEELKIEIYIAAPQKEHAYILILSNAQVNINQLKFDIQAFMLDNYPNEKINLNVEAFENKQILTCSPLKDGNWAADFYRKLSDNEAKVLKTLKKGEYNHFVISADNLTIFKANKDIERYLKFFVKNYLLN
jgi:tetratricopeptide (TPR) repeat protein